MISTILGLGYELQLHHTRASLYNTKISWSFKYISWRSKFVALRSLTTSFLHFRTKNYEFAVRVFNFDRGGRSGGLNVFIVVQICLRNFLQGALAMFITILGSRQLSRATLTCVRAAASQTHFRATSVHFFSSQLTFADVSRFPMTPLCFSVADGGTLAHSTWTLEATLSAWTRARTNFLAKRCELCFGVGGIRTCG